MTERIYRLGTREDFGFGITRCDLHADGCSDIAREGYRYEDGFVGISWSEVLDQVLDQGYVTDTADVTVKPCAKG